MKTSRKLNRKDNKTPQFTAKQNKDVADKISIDKIGCMMVVVWFVMVVAFFMVHLKYS